MKNTATTVYPVTLTKEQLELIKNLVADDVNFCDDGSVDIWNEDAKVMNAGQIFKQCEIAEHVGVQVAWLSVYEMQRAYGGPEEGGWYYTDKQLCSTRAYDSVGALVRAYNSNADSLAEQVGLSREEALAEHITEEWLADTIHRIDSPFTYVKYACFKENRDRSFYLVIEVTPGADVTYVKPIYS